MKNILIHIATWIVAFGVTVFMCSCCTTHYTMRGDTFTVIEESAYYPDSLSKYVLGYKTNMVNLIGNPTSELEVILHKDAFEVGDKVKLIKIEK